MRRRRRHHKTRAPLLVALLLAGACLLYGHQDELEPIWQRLQTEWSELELPPIEFSLTADSRPTWHPWDANAAPDYVQVTGPAQFIMVEPEPGEVAYENLDLLGRTSGAAATVTFGLMEQGTARPRDDMQSLEPSGWGHNDLADIPLSTGGVYHGYFWNRSHLVAKSLGGAEDLRNLVCGTRMQNVGANDGNGGMAWCETFARTWLEQNPQGSMRYEAIPIYEGAELVPRSVVVSMRSSDGAIDQQVEVFNTALGYTIDYTTGEFWES